MIKENKVSKYLLYAIGEIVLVVIGILIALSINNWNTRRINHIKENNYLVNLKRDLNNQLKIIDRNLKGETYIFNSLTKANNNYEKYKKFRAVQEDLVLITPMNNRYTFTITSPTYTELLSTGNLDLISNTVLKNLMVRYYEDLELTSQVIQKNNDYKDNVISLKSLSIIEMLGGSSPEKLYDGMDSSFNNYETPNHLMEIIETNISKPENELILLNLIRFKRLVTLNHISRLKVAKTQTEELLSTLN
ncbi:MAG: hypothetical protein COB12_01840 [Flavobacterium sp.]|nr:MAG: hypothetical protein COB12_01840 [Flavobacterium sp.]